MSRKKDKLVYGWGINDISRPVQQFKNNKWWRCPYYEDWKHIIERCFCPEYKKVHPTYIGCTVCDEWKYLSNFIKWVDSQPNKDWQNCELDKDFLLNNNKCYSPDTVVYMEHSLNKFINAKSKSRGKYMIGVSYKPDKSRINPYEANCKDPFKRYAEYIGVYPTELEAHLAWKAKKHEYACEIAELQDDFRIADRLRLMYATDVDLTRR